MGWNAVPATAPAPRLFRSVRFAGKEAAMLRWCTLLLACLLATSMVASSALHASERVGGSDSHCFVDEAGEHADEHDRGGSDKQVPAPHSGCHAPAAALPSFDVPAISPLFIVALPIASPGTVLRSTANVPDLRPPIA